MREQLAAGIDPLDAREALANAPQELNFEQTTERVHKELLPGWKNKKHGLQWITTLREYAFPTIGSMKLSEIEPRHVADVLRPIWLAKPETASRLKQRLYAV